MAVIESRNDTCSKNNQLNRMDALLEILRLNAIEPSIELQQQLRKLMAHGTLTANGAEKTSAAKFITYCPCPKSQQRTSTSIVSSRLGRKIDQHDEFFRVLRIACSQLNPRRQVLLTAKRTTTHSFVSRAAELFGLDVVEAQIAAPNTSLEQWLDCCSHLSTNDTVLMVWQLPDQSASRTPTRDAVTVNCADQVLAIHMSKSGNTNTLLRERVEQQEPPRVYLAIGNEQLVTQSVADPLMQHGAIGWYLLSSKGGHSTRLLNAEANEKQPVYGLSELPDNRCFLTHCTRGPHGPWPDQSEPDFLDELILGTASRDRSALAALTRIVGQRRILATGEAIRSGTPAVSLTSVPLSELHSLRQFRSHRGRWDFEPYGIAIDRELLVNHGARPAIYGDEDVWRSLSTNDQPYFQRIGEKENSIDWRVEKEFRVLGDIDLDRIPTDKAIVFAPTQQEAEHVASISKWPVVVMNPKT